MNSNSTSVRRSDQSTETASRYKRQYPWAGELAMEISLLLFDASTEHSAALNRMFAAMGEGRIRGRYTTLRILYFADEGRLTQNEIRAAMNVTSPNVTYLIDELEKEGLVRRMPNPSDRRATFVELTPEGERMIGQLAPAMARFMTEMSRDFTDEEQKLFQDFLMRYKRNALNMPVSDGT